MGLLISNNTISGMDSYRVPGTPRSATVTLIKGSEESFDEIDGSQLMSITFSYKGSMGQSQHVETGTFDSIIRSHTFSIGTSTHNYTLVVNADFSKTSGSYSYTISPSGIVIVGVVLDYMTTGSIRIDNKIDNKLTINGDLTVNN